jgi:protein-disulfide isomerase
MAINITEHLNSKQACELANAIAEIVGVDVNPDNRFEIYIDFPVSKITCYDSTQAEKLSNALKKLGIKCYVSVYTLNLVVANF